MNDDLKHLQKLGFRTRSRWDSLAPTLDPATREENKSGKQDYDYTKESSPVLSDSPLQSLRPAEPPTLKEAKKYLQFVAGLQPTHGVTYKTKKKFTSKAKKKPCRYKKAATRSGGAISVKRFFEQQKSWRDQVMSNLEIKRLRTRDDELQRCTFAPKIGTGNKSQSNGHTIVSSKGNIYDRSKKWLKKIERDKTRAKEERKTREKERCTFKPTLVTKEMFPQGRRDASDLYKRVMTWRDKKNWTRTVRRLTSLQDAMRECTFRPVTLCDQKKQHRSNSETFYQQQQDWKAGVEDRTAALERKLHTASMNPKTEEILNDQWFKLQKQVQNDVDQLLDTSELLVPNHGNAEKNLEEKDSIPNSPELFSIPNSPELFNPNGRCSKTSAYPLKEKWPQRLEIDTFHTSIVEKDNEDSNNPDNRIKQAKTGLWESVYNFQRTVSTLKEKLELDSQTRASAPSSRISQSSSDDDRSVNPNPQENLNPGLQHFCNIMENVQTIMNQSESEHEKLTRRRHRMRLNSTPRSEHSERARDYTYYTPTSVRNSQAARTTPYSSRQIQDHPILSIAPLAIWQNIPPEETASIFQPSRTIEILPLQESTPRAPNPTPSSAQQDPPNQFLYDEIRLKHTAITSPTFRSSLPTTELNSVDSSNSYCQDRSVQTSPLPSVPPLALCKR